MVLTGVGFVFLQFRQHLLGVLQECEVLRILTALRSQRFERRGVGVDGRVPQLRSFVADTLSEIKHL